MAGKRRGWAASARKGRCRMAERAPMAARPVKLRSGAWGARVEGDGCMPGDHIIITARNGNAWPATVRRVYWQGDGLAIVSADGEEPEQGPGEPRPAFRRPSRTCPTCKTPNALSAAEAAKGYQCSRCADREEGVGFGA